jgi:hypothetical protein
MKFAVIENFPASLARLWAALAHPDYPAQKYQALGSTGLQLLRFDVSEQVIEVELERTVRAALEAAPAWARPFMDGEQRMRQYGRWQRVSPTQIDAELDLGLVDLPLSAHASGSAVEVRPEHTRLTLRFQVFSRLPAFRGTAARLFAAQARAAMAADHAFTLEYLARH